jgi:hypothetical protein
MRDGTNEVLMPFWQKVCLRFFVCIAVLCRAIVIAWAGGASQSYFISVDYERAGPWGLSNLASFHIGLSGSKLFIADNMKLSFKVGKGTVISNAVLMSLSGGGQGAGR